MDNVFYKPYLNNTDIVYFPYSREQLSKRPIFPAYVYDGGAFFFVNDCFDAANSDKLLDLIMSDKLFEYWHYEGRFDWSAVYKKWTKLASGCEWEAHYWLNRLYILLPLAQRYMCTKDSKYARKWYDLLMDWSDNNPYDPTQFTVHSNCVWRDMQVAWRTINIVHSVFMFGGDHVFSESEWNKIYDLIKLHANHLYRESVEHAKTKVTGNHKQQIAMADIMIGTIFPEFGHSEEFIEVGSTMVADNIAQDFVDGVGVDNSPSYYHFSARLFMEAFLLLRYNGGRQIEGLEESIQKQYEFLYQFSSPCGKTLQFGDSYAMDALADIEFVNQTYPLNFKREKKSMIFAGGQQAVLRNKYIEVYIDAKKTSIKGNGYTWHPHYGKPTYVVYMAGRSIVIDRGCPNYNRGDIYSSHYIESAHNVITCDELPLVTTKSLFPSGVDVQIRITDFKTDGPVQSLAVENTYTGQNGKQFVWTRLFELSDNKLTVSDAVNADEKMHFTSYTYIPGYLNLPAILEPAMPSQRFICKTGIMRVRLDEDVVNISTAGPFVSECRPSINSNNKIDYCNSIEQTFYTDSFSNSITYTYEK